MTTAEASLLIAELRSFPGDLRCYIDLPISRYGVELFPARAAQLDLRVKATELSRIIDKIEQSNITT